MSKRSLDELWSRHILDSIQVYFAVGASVNTWLDIGSGGGLPGVIVGILAMEHAKVGSVHLMESDQRKRGGVGTAKGRD